MRGRVGTWLGVACALGLLAAFSAFLQPVAVSGGSMHPALHHGDVVLVDPHSRPGRGDIALIAMPGHGPVLHRVVAGGGRRGSYVTRGDANDRVDHRRARIGEVRGVVVAVVPVGRALERWRTGSACATLSAQSKTARR